MTPDIPALITKLRKAPQKVGTFGRGDLNPLDEFAPLMTGEERDLLVIMLNLEMHRRALAACLQSSEGCRPLTEAERTSGEG